MSKAPKIKRDRMHLRLDAKVKRKLERAAAYEERSISDFVLVNALAAAERVIQSHEKTTLSVKDWKAFHAALLKPPKPTKALMAAARRHLARTGR
jgi:uncharacterized protein (DUF1778 family)